MALANERDYQHIGMVDFVHNAMDKQTGTIRVRAFDNEDNSLLPGLFARLRTAGSGAYEGILIDDKAVGTDLNNKFVLVVGADGLVEYRGVTLGEKKSKDCVSWPKVWWPKIRSSSTVCAARAPKMQIDPAYGWNGRQRQARSITPSPVNPR